jgi:4-diphosphocytidyl-2-C-methyl-D-erythritol kinase
MTARRSPAKINLCLRVLGRRADGYHDILSLMQRIDLCDEMTFAASGGGIRVRCPGTDLPEDEGNIVTRAAAAFFARTGARPDIEIVIRKRIPVAAGLGGGSSNAATTLMTLNDLSGTPLSQPELMEMGARLGADVPFFLFGRTAWATGIGERLEEAPPLPPCWLVLVNPGFEIPTRTVYQGLNLGLTKEPIHYSIPRFFTVEELVRGLANDLEGVSIRLHPVLDEIKTLLLGNGACGALMSGSGPTVFGIFADGQSAGDAATRLRRETPWRVFGARPL